jgi:glycerol-3-phosphate dehydrogenase
VRPGKGIHIYLDRRVSDYAVMVKAIDGRRVFIEPWQNTSVIGTTDDDYYGDLDNVFATTDEVRYLTDAIAQVLPDVRHCRAIGTWSGVRPSLYAWGKLEDELSREHELVDHEQDSARGLLSMIGGKLASYRLFAEEATDWVCAQLQHAAKCTTHLTPLPGGEAEVTPEQLTLLAPIDLLSASRLVYRHGAGAVAIARAMGERPEEAEIVCACEPVTRAEVRVCVEKEWAFDVNSIARRTRLGLGSCGGLGCAARCGALVAQLLNQSPADGLRHTTDFLARQAKHRASVLGPVQTRQEMLLEADLHAQLPEGYV